MAPQIIPIRERFEKFIIPEPNSGCWLWTGNTDWGGYPKITMNKEYGNITRTNRVKRADRIAWRLYRGEIPDGLFVLHKCDTPNCVNPEHLFLGTAADNKWDCMAKGRISHQMIHVGESHVNAKLTENQIREIRNDPRGVVAIAKTYGVTYQAIQLIKSRKNWKHI